MPAQIIDGHSISSAVVEETKKELTKVQQLGIKPALAVVLVGKNPASELYVKKKKKLCEQLGIGFELHRCKESTKEEELKAVINELNFKHTVHGILVQLPLPKHLNRESILNSISPLKDVDGFTAVNLGMLLYGKEGFAACTAKGVINLIESTGKEIESSNVCIVNHSIVVGRPLAMMLLNRNATVAICHEFTRKLPEHTKKADILVTAVGKPGLIKAQMVKKGAGCFLYFTCSRRGWPNDCCMLDGKYSESGCSAKKPATRSKELCSFVTASDKRAC